MYYAIEIKHTNGDTRYEGLFGFEPQGYKLKQYRLKYPKAFIQPVTVHAIVPCWSCGEPILITDPFKALKTCQSTDQMKCQGCEETYEQDKAPGATS